MTVMTTNGSVRAGKLCRPRHACACVLVGACMRQLLAHAIVWRAVIDANGVTDLLVAGLDGGEVEDDDDAAVLHGVADELVQPDDAELLQLPPQQAAPQVSAVS